MDFSNLRASQKRNEKIRGADLILYFLLFIKRIFVIRWFQKVELYSVKLLFERPESKRGAIVAPHDGNNRKQVKGKESVKRLNQ